MNALIKVCDHLLESASLLDHHGRYLYVNHAAEQLIGRSRYEVIGKSYLEVFPDSTEVPFQPAFERAVTVKGAERFEAHLASCNRWFDVEVYPLDSTVFVLWSEASERKRAEAALAQSRAREQSFRDQAKDFSEMLRSCLLRELKDPIEQIAAAARVLKESKNGATERAQEILTKAQRMSRVVAQLADLARLRLESEILLMRKPVDLTNLAQTVVDKLKSAYPHCRVACESMGDAMGQWDPERLHQVLFALAESALEHNSAGSVIFHIDGRAPDGLTLRIEHSGTASHRTGGDRADQEEARELVHHLAQNLVMAHGGTFHTERNGPDSGSFVIHLGRGPSARRASHDASGDA